MNGDMTDKETDLIERKLEITRQIERVEARRKRKKTPLTLELFRRTMSLMTIDRSSSFSCKKEREKFRK